MIQKTQIKKEMTDEAYFGGGSFAFDVGHGRLSGGTGTDCCH
jgi:hypothetical protein